MRKVVNINEYGKKPFQQEYELEGLDDELVTLAQKLVACNPSEYAPKKEGNKKKLIKELMDRRIDLDLSMASGPSELADDELDSAAGGCFNMAEPGTDTIKRLLDELEKDKN